jgi:hypothetical protein
MRYGSGSLLYPFTHTSVQTLLCYYMMIVCHRVDYILLQAN